MSGGYTHDAAMYADDAGLLALVVPFLVDGVDAGDPTIVALDPPRAGAVRRALASVVDLRRVTFVPVERSRARPSRCLQETEQQLRGLLAGGATCVRAVGAVPLPAPGASWQPWARFESFCNRAFEGYPLWAICPYDERTTPQSVLDQVRATHRHLLTPERGRQPSPTYQDVDRFLAGHLDDGDHPLERGPPVFAVTDPALADARAMTRDLAVGVGVAPLAVDELVTACSEVVTNAFVHGVGPVLVSGWSGADRAVVAVSDRGSGPDDPSVGLVPVARPIGEGGFGLWLANQCCSEVGMRVDRDGFRVRLTAVVGDS